MQPVHSVTHVSGLDPGKNGAPGGTRTPDPLLRRQTLYPAELRAHTGGYDSKIFWARSP